MPHLPHVYPCTQALPPRAPRPLLSNTISKRLLHVGMECNVRCSVTRAYACWKRLCFFCTERGLLLINDNSHSSTEGYPVGVCLRHAAALQVRLLQEPSSSRRCVCTNRTARATQKFIMCSSRIREISRFELRELRPAVKHAWNSAVVPRFGHHCIMQGSDMTRD